MTDRVDVDVCEQVENILRPLDLSDDDYRKVMSLMLDNMERGLRSDTNGTATVKMYPTYVRAVPDGTGTLLTSLVLCLPLPCQSICAVPPSL